MADFTYDSNYSPANSFRKVRFGANAPVLETELNELQDILRNNLESFLRNSVGSGVINKGSYSINGSTLTLNNYYTLVDGVVQQLNPTLSITLPAKPTSGAITYFAFMETWSTTANYQSNIYGYGQFNGPTIPNNLLDPRVGVESTERLEQVWQIRLIQNDFINYPSGFQNPSVTVQGYYGTPTNITFGISNYDSGLYSAVLGDGTVVKAIPLLKITTTPGDYQVSPVYNDVSLRDSIQSLQNQITTLGSGLNPFPQYVLNNSLGNQTMQGGLTVTGEMITGTDVIINGNLTVKGTMTNTSTTTLNIGDQWMVLNENETGTPTLNAGLLVNRGSAAQVGVRWNEGNELWELTNDGTNWHTIVADASGTGVGGEITYKNGYGWIGYIGGDNTDDDFEIGSLTSGTRTFTLWNRADGVQMNLNVGTLHASQNGIFDQGINVGGNSTFAGNVSTNGPLTVNGVLNVQATADSYVNAPSLWVGNSTGYIRLTDSNGVNYIESVNGAQNGNLDLMMTGAWGNTGGNFTINYNTTRIMGTLTTGDTVVSDGAHLYFGPAGDDSDSVFFTRVHDTTDSNGLNLVIGDNGGQWPSKFKTGGTGDYFRISTADGTDVLYAISTGDISVGRNVTIPGTLYLGDATVGVPTHSAMRATSGNTVLTINPDGGFNTVMISGTTSIGGSLSITSPNAVYGNVSIFAGGEFTYDGGSDKTFWFQHRTGTATNVGTTSFVDSNGKPLFSVATDGTTYANGTFGVGGTTTLNDTIVNDGHILSFGPFFDNTDPIYFSRTNDANDVSGLHLYIGNNGGQYPSYLQPGGAGDYFQITTTDNTDVLRAISTGDVFIGRNLVVPNSIYMGTNTTTLPNKLAMAVNGSFLDINPNDAFTSVRVGSNMQVGNNTVATTWVDVEALSDHGFSLNGKPVMGYFPGWNTGLWINTMSNGTPHPSLQVGTTVLSDVNVIGGNVSITGVAPLSKLQVSLTPQPSTLIAGTTYFYGVSIVTNGETTLSPVEAITLDKTSNSVKLSWYDTKGAYAYNVYRGTNSNNMTFIYQVLASQLQLDPAVPGNVMWVDNGSATSTNKTIPATNTAGGSLTVNALNGNTGQFNTLTVNGALVTTSGSENVLGGDTNVQGNMIVNGTLFFGGGQADDDMYGDPLNNDDPVYMYVSYDANNQTGLHVVLGENNQGNQDYFQVETGTPGNKKALLRITTDGNLEVEGSINMKGILKGQIYEIHDHSTLIIDSGELAPDPLSWTGIANAWSPANGDKTNIFIAHVGKVGVRFGDYAISVRARIAPFLHNVSAQQTNLYQSQALGIKTRYYYNSGTSYFDMDEWFDSNQFAYGTSWYYQDGNKGDYGVNTFDEFYTKYVNQFFTTYSAAQQWVEQYWETQCALTPVVFNNAGGWNANSQQYLQDVLVNGQNTYVLDIVVDDHKETSNALTLTVNTTQANEMILIGFNGWNGWTNTSSASCTVDGKPASLVTSDASGVGATASYIFSYVAPTAGSHTVTITENNVKSPYIYLYATSLLNSQGAMIQPAVVNTGYASSISSGIYGYAGGYLFGSFVANTGNSAASTITWSGLSAIGTSQHQQNGVDSGVAGKQVSQNGYVYTSVANSVGAVGSTLLLVSIKPAPLSAANTPDWCSLIYKNGYWQYAYYPVNNASWSGIIQNGNFYLDYTNFYTNFTYQKQMVVPGTNNVVSIDWVDVGVVTNQNNFAILIDSITIQPVHPGVVQ